jgi:hypothetical protein
MFGVVIELHLGNTTAISCASHAKSEVPLRRIAGCSSILRARATNRVTLRLSSSTKPARSRASHSVLRMRPWRTESKAPRPAV